MKNLSLIIWLTQLGLSVAIPPAVLIWLAVWLRNRYDWGVWVIVVGAVLGMAIAVNGFRTSLKAMEHLAREKKKDNPPIFFNDHD